MEKAWKLGEDLHTEDSLLDGLTFADAMFIRGGNDPGDKK